MEKVRLPSQPFTYSHIRLCNVQRGTVSKFLQSKTTENTVLHIQIYICINTECIFKKEINVSWLYVFLLLVVESRHHLEYLTRIWRPETRDNLMVLIYIKGPIVSSAFHLWSGSHGARGAARHIIGNGLAISRGGYLTCSNDFYLPSRRLDEGGQHTVEIIDEMYRTCRICSFHFRRWLVYVETLLDCGVYRITSVPLSHIHSYASKIPLSSYHQLRLKTSYL
jgi:hypothetical protein